MDAVVDEVNTVVEVAARDVAEDVVVRAGATQPCAAEDETGSRRERTVIIPAADRVRENAFLLDEHGEVTGRVAFGGSRKNWTWLVFPQVGSNHNLARSKLSERLEGDVERGKWKKCIWASL